MVQKRKWKFNKDWSRDFAWIAKLPDNGMAQCNLCAMDVSISSGGRTDVRRHQESPRHAKLAKSKGSTKGGMVQCVAHGQNEVDGVTRAEPCAKRRRVDQPIAPGGDLFDFLDADEPITTGVAGSSESEVEEYLAQPPPLEKTSDPLQFWQTHEKKWPNLAILASRYLTIPASSAPVERLFSIAGKVFRPERASLSDKRFEELMFIRCNKWTVNLHDGALVITCWN